MEAIFFFEFYPLWRTKIKKEENNNNNHFDYYYYIFLVHLHYFRSIFRNNSKKRTPSGKKNVERKESFRFIYPYRYSIYRPLATNNPSPLLFLARRLTFPSVTPNSRQFSLLTETWKRSIESESYAYSHFPFPSPRTRNLRGDLRIRNLVINKTTLFFARIFNYQLFKRIFFSLDRVTNSQMINSLIFINFLDNNFSFTISRGNTRERIFF